METIAIHSSTDRILDLLRRFVAQRSGISFADYGDRDSFMSDYRTILRHGRDARRMLASLEARALETETLREELGRGRLLLTDKGLDYCTGQCFWMEYRGAACRAIASCFWAEWRDAGLNREAIIKKATRLFGRGVASRWFN